MIYHIIDEASTTPRREVMGATWCDMINSLTYVVDIAYKMEAVAPRKKYETMIVFMLRESKNTTWKMFCIKHPKKSIHFRPYESASYGRNTEKIVHPTK